MVLFPYQRLAYLYDTIKNEVLPQQELANHFCVSVRTIRTDISRLNDILSHYGAHIAYKKNMGYQLVIYDDVSYKKISSEEIQLERLPRNSRERVLELLIHFLTQPTPIKLDDIAGDWFTSRSTIQSDLSEVKEFLEKYDLFLDSKPYYGLKLIGEEPSIRVCLTNILWQLYIADDDRTIVRLQQTLLQNIDLNYLKKILQNQFERFELKFPAEGQSYLLYSCAVSIARITMGKELAEYPSDKFDNNITKAAMEISDGLTYFLGSNLSEAEFNYLCVQLASRNRGDSTAISPIIQENSYGLIDHILTYINHHYNYDLCADKKLMQDLFEHISAMLSRIKYQIHSTNPLLNEIKQYYPFAYDITLSAVTNTEKYTEFKLTEDEISYLAVHIGVALERNYSAKHERHAHILLVSELANSTLNLIVSKIKRSFPLVHIARMISIREYEQLQTIEEDFIVTTARLIEKDKPIVKIAPFPTSYQLEQLGRLAMIDRTMPYILERFFNERFFMVINNAISQQELFKIVCKKLKLAGIVNDDFYPSLVERESIVSTLLGENIAIPHSVGLLAVKTQVVTILAPNGILWDKNKNEIAKVVFLLAISKDEYEDAMGIYNLVVNFVKEKSTKRLLNSRSFSDFQAIVKDSFSRMT